MFLYIFTLYFWFSPSDGSDGQSTWAIVVLGPGIASLVFWARKLLFLGTLVQKITNRGCSLYVPVRSKFKAAVSIMRAIWRGYSWSPSLYWRRKSHNSEAGAIWRQNRRSFVIQIGGNLLTNHHEFLAKPENAGQSNRKSALMKVTCDSKKLWYTKIAKSLFILTDFDSSTELF